MISKLFLLFFSVVAGVLLVLLFKPKNQRNLKLLVSFSGAFLLSITFLHLLPEVFESDHGHHNHQGHHTHDHSVGLMILLGFIFQVVLEWLSSGIEHGHMHTKQTEKGLVPLSVLAGLFLHAFFEGLPLLTQSNEVSSRSLLWGIVIHNIPVSMILYIMLLKLEVKKQYIWLAMGLFAVAAPIAALLGQSIPAGFTYSKHITAFVIGIFFHISTTILFESSENHRFNLAKILIVMVAGVLAWFSVLH
jgi:zinc transporter ZupT